MAASSQCAALALQKVTGPGWTGAVGCYMGRERDGRATLAEAEGEMVKVVWVSMMAYAEPDEITPKASAAAKVMMNGGIRTFGKGSRLVLVRGPASNLKTK
jgi:hypothetical protein